MLRRDFLRHVVVASTGLVAGCGDDPLVPGMPGGGQRLIDMHCHVFNASDLPVERFLRQVVAEDYPAQARARIMGIRDREVADQMYELAVRLIGAYKAPTADQEIAVLKGESPPVDSATSISKARAAAIEDTARFLLEVDSRSRGSQTMGQSGEAVKRSAAAEADQKFLDLFLGSRTDTQRMEAGVMSMTEARAASAGAFSGHDIIGRHLKWFSLFRLYRHVLVDRLVEDIDRQGFNAELLTPALVDYDEWLFQDVTRSPLPRQMVVMDWISRRATGPAVHGYIGFDPLREVASRAGVKGATVSSLATARTALTEHGFIGVKLYPPMGFRASGNTRPYPKRTVKQLGFVPDEELNGALRDLYALCTELDAPIIAHGYASNGAGPEYAMRGDPAFWLPIFRDYPELRVCLAHFGRFDVKSHGREALGLPEASWEWRVGEYIRANPQQRIFVDLSYFAEALHAKTELRSTLAGLFKRWVDEFDREADHILFGTDWIMLGREAGHEHYVESVNTFLRKDCGFDDATCDKIFRSNALRFLPLEYGTRGRRRLLEWYARNKIDPGRLPQPPASWRGLFEP